MGKPVASDLRSGNLTLPAIVLRERHPDHNPIGAIFENRERERNLEIAIEMIRESEIISECYGVVQDFTSEACRALQVLPEGPCRQALFELAGYLVERQQ